MLLYMKTMIIKTNLELVYVVLMLGSFFGPSGSIISTTKKLSIAGWFWVACYTDDFSKVHKNVIRSVAVSN